MSTRLTALPSVACVWLAGAVASLVLFLLLNTTTSNGLEILPGDVQSIGSVNQCSKIGAMFELHNHGPKTISLLGGSSSCGCTEIKLTRKSLKPQESANVLVTYSSAQARGDINARAAVAYSVEGEEQPRFQPLMLIGKIDPAYSVTPESVDFDAGVDSVRTITFQSQDGSPLHVLKVECDKRFFSARAWDEAQAASTATVEVSFDPSKYYADSGPAHAHVHTDNALQPVMMVPLKVRVQP